MTLTRSAQRTLTGVFAAILLVLYGRSWLQPGIGLYREDAANLVALGFTHATMPPVWVVKSFALACTFAWLALTYKLLRRMGASHSGALLLIVLTAASPLVIRLGTNVFPEPLFALVLTAALLAFLSRRLVVAGVLAGLLFTSVALLHFSSGGHALRANEKLVVWTHNFLFLLAGPFETLTGIYSLYAIEATVILIVWALIRRRQLFPDVFLAVYCVILLFRVEPPLPLIAPVLPLVLWILWRAFHTVRIREALVACALILVSLSLWADIRGDDTDDWNKLETVFTYIRNNTPADAVILSDLDPAVFLNTGRQAIRGFEPNNYNLYYGPPTPAVTPDQLTSAIQANGVTYVALSPARNLPESIAYHKAVEALERGGTIEAVPVPGLDRAYRVLQTVGR